VIATGVVVNWKAEMVIVLVAGAVSPAVYHEHGDRPSAVRRKGSKVMAIHPLKLDKGQSSRGAGSREEFTQDR
jgi:hypothetical protein